MATRPLTEDLELARRASFRINAAGLEWAIKQRFGTPPPSRAELVARLRRAGVGNLPGERTLRDMLQAQGAFDRVRIEALAEALKVKPQVIIDIDAPSAFDLVRDVARDHNAVHPGTLFGLLGSLASYFEGVLQLVYFQALPPKALLPHRRPIGVQRPRKPGYAQFEIWFSAPVFTGWVSYSVRLPRLTLWIDYGELFAESERAQRFSREPWVKDSSRRRDKHDVVAGRLRFMTYYDNFPEEFVLSCSDPTAEVREVGHVDISTGERLLSDPESGWVGFARTFHADPPVESTSPDGER